MAFLRVVQSNLNMIDVNSHQGEWMGKDKEASWKQLNESFKNTLRSRQENNCREKEAGSEGLSDFNSVVG